MIPRVTASGRIISFSHLTDKAMIAHMLCQRWGHDGLVVMGKVWTSKDLEGIGAYDEQGKILAVASWIVRVDTVILASIDSIAERQGVGSVLISAFIEHARSINAKRVRAVVTNDNFEAMRFYQKRNFKFTALYVNAADAFRAIFQDMPKRGFYDIPIRDTLELELIL